MQDAKEMCQRVADHIECDPAQVLVMSTGVIGQTLPMDSIRSGIDQGIRAIAASDTGFLDAADAICTTDKCRKIASAEIQLDGQTYRVAAMAKGAGMIAPNMATMLAVIVTDAPIDQSGAQSLLKQTADVSFNRVSVDGHTSTNDTLLLLSSGIGSPISGDALRKLQEAIDGIAIQVAKMLVADGEGASHVMSIEIAGAASDDQAATIARTVAASPLVKTAITGGDPNWGRIVSAAGYAEAKIEPSLVSLSICGTRIYEQGKPIPFDESALSQEMQKAAEIAIELTVGSGNGKAQFWASDLTTEYVRFNSEYTT